RTFEPVAANKGIEFAVSLGPNLPQTIRTDSSRLQQVLNNLLSNAFKFTSEGNVGLRIEMARKGLVFNSDALNQADNVVAFSVIDTGIGIAQDKHRIIFEAFQQADGTTSRKYGGAGPGPNIKQGRARGVGGGEPMVRWHGAERGSTFV